MSVNTKSYLANRRNRMVGTIMGFLEHQVFPQLSEAKQDEIRRVIRDAVNQYHDSVLDLVKSEDGVVRNEEVIALLERVARNLPNGKPLTAALRQTGTPSEPMQRVTPAAPTQEG